MSKKERLMPNVSVKQCFGTIFFSIFACVIAFIPLTFGSIPTTFTYEYLPFVGNDTITQVPPFILQGIVKILNLQGDFLKYVEMALNYNVVVYFYILAFNIAASLVLIILRLSILRIIFKLVSIIAGIAMLAIAVTNALYIAGFAGNFIHGTIPIENIMSALETSRVLLALGLFIFSLIMVKKQFKWFAKLY